MHGLIVIGTAPGTAELEVARAICSASGSGGLFEVSPYESLAPPLVAARLAGAQLSPKAVLDEARAREDALLAVATRGGLVAPLSERYTNRDFAHELGLPVIVAVPAAEGMAAQALLTAEAAAASGLAVPALVIAGWPESPSRVMLEERALLERLLPVPVLTLGEDGARGWPIDAWAGSAPGTSAPSARITLEPYTPWEPRPVGDPRSTPRASIMDAMLEIIAAEGPLTATRAYSLYNRASGGRKLTSVARAPLSSSIYWLAQEHKVALVRKEEIPWQDDDIVRMPDSPAVRVRELGPRSLDEVPLDEIAELVQRLRAAGSARDDDEAKRAVLDTYGLVRLTSRADEYLGLALGLVASGRDPRE